LAFAPLGRIKSVLVRKLFTPAVAGISAARHIARYLEFRMAGSRHRLD
jgi:hypothetical protein